MPTVISLGRNCNPRGFIKTNLKLSKSSGYKSSVFDLCITDFDTLCKVLKTDFKDFFDLKIIKWVNADGNRRFAGPGLTCVSNKDGIIFNHEGAGHSHLFREGTNDDAFYTRNNFKEFKKRYYNRILNFRNYCKYSNEIIFIHNHKDFDESIIYNIITKTYGKKIIKFISLT
jgi:hypothetical protein